MPTPAVQLDDVTVTIGRTRALHGVSLSVQRGTHLALTGSNGSGKSTLLSVVAGILQPTAGRMTRLPGRVAWVAQRSEVPHALPVTVRQVVLMGRWAHRGAWRPLTRTDRALVAHALEALGLETHAARPLADLSGGQRQRAFVAQAIVQRADLLLLDEPTVGLDAEAQELIATALAAESARGATILHATHDLAAMARADAVVTLASGSLVE